MKKLKLKDLLLKETITWNNRKFGERLPTLADYKEAHNKKETVTEDSMSPSYRRMWNALDNVIPMVFPDSLMLAGSGNPIGAFKQMLQVGDTQAIKEWPKIEKWINKKFKEVKLSKIKKDQELLKVLSKTGKGMKI